MDDADDMGDTNHGTDHFITGDNCPSGGVLV